ncbi:LytTR family transcriptional regulator DNA-binding domain-containing protein [Polaribacter septentrionalilitoris]|uniref:LytTR family transcriptional regulator DNA-binding domain-containing protein n=1 Tax=Polaribacter septentrionalilitoris TaxID=2494657 RepID=UPI001F350A8F|nr:LytTR family transcriptional regulator DNA-binding domain-containing protein [Polaribacter septentrionalilitoris]
MKKNSILNTKYPFDSSLKHHIIIALGLALWIFIFLYFTEPLDVNEFRDTEKLIYLPLYGLLGAFCYVLFLPLQSYLFHKNDKNWFVKTELLFFLIFSSVSILAARLFYLYVIVPGEPNPYTLWYHLKSIIFPALLTILPIVIFGRFAFGKYKNKKIDEQKIEIKGKGNYEGLRVLLNDLICIQSSDNYIEVFYVSGKDVKKTLIRNKLSKVAAEFSDLLRVHRSYIINPYHFKQWKTEKGKLFAELSSSIFIPISNTYKNEVKSVLNSTTE